MHAASTSRRALIALARVRMWRLLAAAAIRTLPSSSMCNLPSDVAYRVCGRRLNSDSGSLFRLCRYFGGGWAAIRRDGWGSDCGSSTAWCRCEGRPAGADGYGSPSRRPITGRVGGVFRMQAEIFESALLLPADSGGSSSRRPAGTKTNCELVALYVGTLALPVGRPPSRYRLWPVTTHAARTHSDRHGNPPPGRHPC